MKIKQDPNKNKINFSQKEHGRKAGKSKSDSCHLRKKEEKERERKKTTKQKHLYHFKTQKKKRKKKGNHTSHGKIHSFLVIIWRKNKNNEKEGQK